MSSPAPYGAYPPPPPPPARTSSSKVVVIVLCSVLGAFVVLCGGCGVLVLVAGNSAGQHHSATSGVATGPAVTGSAAAVPEATSGSPAPSPTGRTVVFTVTADSGQASITYGVNLNEQQDTEATLPWSQTIKVDPTDVLSDASLWAQNGGDGTISCSITVDGSVVKQSSSRGPYAIAQCDYYRY